jgi:L-malate glycosyltransferase
VEDLLRRPGWEISVVLFNEGRLAEQLRGFGVPVTVFPETEWSALKVLRKLTAHCRNGRFDILHTHKYRSTQECCVTPVSSRGGHKENRASVPGV